MLDTTINSLKTDTDTTVCQTPGTFRSEYEYKIEFKPATSPELSLFHVAYHQITTTLETRLAASDHDTGNTMPYSSL